MTIKCIIIDDEPIACKGMQEYVGQVDFLELAGVYEDPLQAYSILDTQSIDLILLDIEMPRVSGIDFIRSLKNPPLIIFTTAYSNYALEGYELDVVDFLVKPVSLARFIKAVNKVKELMPVRAMRKTEAAVENDHFFIKENGRFVKIHYDDLLYAEAMQNYIALHLSEKKLITYITLSLLEKQLPSAQFMKVHKSYIVALQKISAIEGNTVLIGSDRITVSRNLKESLLQKLMENKLLKR